MYLIDKLHVVICRYAKTNVVDMHSQSTDFVVPPSRKDYRIMGLFWAGSLLANMSIFVTGIVVGELLFPPPSQLDSLEINGTSGLPRIISVTV